MQHVGSSAAQTKGCRTHPVQETTVVVPQRWLWHWSKPVGTLPTTRHALSTHLQNIWGFGSPSGKFSKWQMPV
jgi:hypothetical protein